MNTERFKTLTVVLQHEANSIFDDSGEMVKVSISDDGQAVGLNWKGKSLTVRAHPRLENALQYDLWHKRSGYMRVHTLPSAAVNLMQILSRS